ncbi:hypothetical protein CBL_21177, partial [Carabus blaptoides fortunei]
VLHYRALRSRVYHHRAPTPGALPPRAPPYRAPPPRVPPSRAPPPRAPPPRAPPPRAPPPRAPPPRAPNTKAPSAPPHGALSPKTLPSRTRPIWILHILVPSPKVPPSKTLPLKGLSTRAPPNRTLPILCQSTRALSMEIIPTWDYNCTICGKVWTKKQSLNQHMRHRHPTEYNLAMKEEARRTLYKQWFPREIEEMAEAEARYNGKKLNSFLVELTGRSIDSVKNRRKRKDYKDMVANIKKKLDENLVPVDESLVLLSNSVDGENEDIIWDGKDEEEIEEYPDIVEIEEEYKRIFEKPEVDGSMDNERVDYGIDISYSPITKEDLQKILKEMKPTAPGSDGITLEKI